MTIQKADVVIIGAGSTGLSTAYELAKAGVDVLVVDRRFIAIEAAGRNPGGIRQIGRDTDELPLMVAAMRRWHALSEELGYFVDNLRNAETIDVAHRVDSNAGFFHKDPFVRVEIADADVAYVFRVDLSHGIIEVYQFRNSKAAGGRENHSVDVPARCGLRGIEVAMCIDPKNPRPLARC